MRNEIRFVVSAFAAVLTSAAAAAVRPEMKYGTLIEAYKKSVAK